MATRGEQRHLVQLQGPGGPPVPDGEGGWTTPPTDLDPPTWFFSIRRASVRDLERLTSGTTLNAASYILEGDYHSGITQETQITFEGRILFVNDLVNVDERDIDLIVFCQELVP